MGIYDAALLPSRASIPTTFLKICGRGESLVTTICLKTVVGVNKGMLPVRYFYSIQASFFVSVECHGDCKTVTKMR